MLINKNHKRIIIKKTTKLRVVSGLHVHVDGYCKIKICYLLASDVNSVAVAVT